MAQRGGARPRRRHQGPASAARRVAFVAAGVLGTVSVVGLAGPIGSGPAGAEGPVPARIVPAAAAQEPDPEPRPVGELPDLAPELAEVEVTSQDYDAAVVRRDRLADQRAAAARLIAQKGAEIVELTARDTTLTQEIDDARSNARYWEGRVEHIATTVREIAVSSYISGAGDALDPVLDLDVEAQQDRATQEEAVRSLSERRTAELQQAQRNARNNRSIEQLSTALRHGVRSALAAARLARDEATADEARLAVDLVGAERAIVDESRLATVVGADFPLVVLDAYWKGAARMAVLAPGCGVPWWGLAGIGKVESRHGTYGGSDVRPDGSLTKPIIGIPLTGFGGTAAIGDSDGGAIDGDPTVDRAAGPMQFIPQTWAAWGRDGDDDGRIEIQNIYDAAAGAAAYLCASGPLADDAGLSRGYFSYNHSLDYVASVLAQAKGYAAAVTVPAG